MVQATNNELFRNILCICFVAVTTSEKSVGGTETGEEVVWNHPSDAPDPYMDRAQCNNADLSLHSLCDAGHRLTSEDRHTISNKIQQIYNKEVSYCNPADTERGTLVFVLVTQASMFSQLPLSQEDMKLHGHQMAEELATNTTYLTLPSELTEAPCREVIVVLVSIGDHTVSIATSPHIRLKGLLLIEAEAEKHMFNSDTDNETVIFNSINTVMNRLNKIIPKRDEKEEWFRDNQFTKVEITMGKIFAIVLILTIVMWLMYSNAQTLKEACEYIRARNTFRHRKFAADTGAGSENGGSYLGNPVEASGSSLENETYHNEIVAQITTDIDQEMNTDVGLQAVQYKSREQDVHFNSMPQTEQSKGSAPAGDSGGSHGLELI